MISVIGFEIINGQRGVRATSYAEHDYDLCECGRCIKRRVWHVIMRTEAELRDNIACERVKDAEFLR